MGFRFSRSLRLGKFIRLNLSKSGVGFSIGVPGFRLSYGPRGARLTTSIPGSGLSYSTKLGGKKRRAVAEKALSHPEPEALPAPDANAPEHEQAFAEGLTRYLAEDPNAALPHLLAAAPQEPSAAILASAIQATQPAVGETVIERLEGVLQAEDEFPTALMKKYRVAELTFPITLTPSVEVEAPCDALGAVLLLAELYQQQGRLDEATALLEEAEEVAGEPLLTLSLCELYTLQQEWNAVIHCAARVEISDDITLETVILHGRALQEKGLHDAAVALFTKALRRRKGYSEELLNEAAYWRALSYESLGKRARANQEFQKIYADSPTFRDVATRIGA